MKKIIITSIVLVIGFTAFFFGGKKVFAKDITIEPAGTEKPSEDYYSADYIRMRNALNEIGNAGGGTLIVKGGHYYISNTLYVASNTNIYFDEDKPTTLEKVGGSISSNTLFQLIPYKYKDSSNVVGGYNGVHNVQFLGRGQTVFDLKNKNNGSTPEIAIVMANNSDVYIRGINFKNIKNGHFIEMDGCRNVSISNCSFSNMADNKYHNKEAINLDTNDKKTGGFSQKWSKKDKTPNKKIYIYICSFRNLVRAVGTHRYSKGKYHTNISVTNCSTRSVKTPIAMLNWKNSEVRCNYFFDSKPNKRYNYSFFMAGVRNLRFEENSLRNIRGKPVLKYYAKYQTSHKEYKATKSKLTKKNIKSLKKNYISNGTKRKFKIGKKTYKWIKIPNI